MRTLHFRAARSRAAALALVPALVLLTAPDRADAQAARLLTQADYEIWRSIQGTTLSRDGRWVAYSLAPQVGDGELVVRSTRDGVEHRVPRGFIGRPQLQPNADSGFTAPPPAFSADGRVAVAMAYAPRSEFERARRARRVAEQPRASLAIVSLPDGRITSVPRVRSFAMPRETGRWLAYLLEPADSAARATGADSAGTASRGMVAATPGGTPRPVADGDRRAGGRRPESGSTLVVRDLATGTETRIDDVTTYAFADSGQWLVYAAASRTAGRSGAYARALGAAGIGPDVALLSGRGSYRGLTLDRAGRQAAFVSDHADSASASPRFSLYHARLGASATTRAVVTPASIRPELVVAERGIAFTRDGSGITFGLAPTPADSVPADSLADKAVLDLWHYKDTRLQPQQRLDAVRDRSRAFTAIYHVGAGRLVQLGSDSLPQVALSDDGQKGLAVTSVPYALDALWGEGGSDVYLLDARTGARRAVATRVPFRAELSPAGRYVVWYADKRWNAFDAQSGKTINLTGALLGVRFDDEAHDAPSDPAPYGVAGWTPNDGAMLVYSRYDVWEIDPAGRRPARVVTDSAGARAGVQLRIVNASRARGRSGGDGASRVIDPTQPLLLSAFDTRTKQAGFWRDRLDAASAPERIVMADARFGTPVKAADAEVYAVTRERFDTFGDLWVGPRLDQLAKVSDANPQQKQYAWGSAELVEWMNADGTPLQGVLYKPASFDASKKYPMVVYYYERLSDNLHQYHAPFGRNTINPTVYASNGYVVFFPDVAYTTGQPGPSALKAIVPGVQAIVARGFVNPKAVGLAGQSWGGYQNAYIVTQTPMFAAAFLGAPVANMTSAYGGIRWESGNSRVQQYERGQSRIGGTLWQSTLRFIENSPLFYIDRVTTPVLIMSNDADGAVPWQQGIELFIGLKRFGKEAYLVNYNGDGHNPRKRANQMDIDRRMHQFFATKLKGAPPPEWMEKGIPFVAKGRDQLAPIVAPAAGTVSTQAPQP